MRVSIVVPHVFVLAITLGNAAGCSSSSPAAPACVAGTTQACLCVGGGTGVQSCKDDGSGYGICDCGADTGPKDTGTDSSAETSLDSTTPDADATTSETAGETSADATTDGATDSGGGKFTGATAASWESRKGDLGGPTGFSEYTSAGVGYFFATYANSGGAMARYDIATDSWTPVLKNPWGIENYKGLGWSGGFLYQAKDNYMYRYTIASDSWANVASALPGTFSSMHAHDDGTKLYTLASDGTNRLVVFDTATSLVTYTTGPTGTVYHPRLAWDGLTKALYIAPSADLTLLWSYTPATGAIAARAVIPETTMGRAFCSDRAGHIYATGDNSSAFSSNVVWQYDTAANTWKKVPDLPFVHGSNGACTVTDDGWLYVANGIDKLARLKLL
ncbi:MAG: hypothetical protein IPJ34_28165 [Myxococcales bacterium]|nr:hypothetical protein [Myxococcales bacterium]